MGMLLSRQALSMMDDLGQGSGRDGGGWVASEGVVPMFYDYMLVYQGSSIKSSLSAFLIFLSAPALAAFSCVPQLPRNYPGRA